MQQYEIDLQGIMEFMPHRAPFLFLDGIESIRLPHREGMIKNGELKVQEMKDLLIKAHYHVPVNLEIFNGHFPTNPVLPGVIQIEIMAQASCFGLRKMIPDHSDFKLEVALLKVESSRFRSPVKPGMNLLIESLCTRVRGNMVTYECKIINRENNEVMSEAVIWASHNCPHN